MSAHGMRVRTAEARLHCASMALAEAAELLAHESPVLEADALLAGEAVVLVRLMHRIKLAREVLGRAIGGEVA